LKGYLDLVLLTEYDMKSVILFSIRYLFSDENYYTYLLSQGNDSVEKLIAEVKRKQEILLNYISSAI